MKKNNIINKIREEIKLKTDIKVVNEMGFIDLITSLGYREDKMWSDNEDELLQKLCDLAENHTELIVKQINEQIDKRINQIKNNGKDNDAVIEELEYLKTYFFGDE